MSDSLFTILIDSSVLILVPLQLYIRAGVSHPKEQLDTKHLKRGVDHIETPKRQIIEPPMHKLQGQSIQMHAHAINHYMINLANKIKTQLFMHLHHHTSNNLLCCCVDDMRCSVQIICSQCKYHYGVLKM